MIDREGLFKIWDDACKSQEAARQALNHVDTQLANAREALAATLIPPDAVPGEQFGVWICDVLIQVTVAQPPRIGTVDVSEGQRPHELKIRARLK